MIARAGRAIRRRADIVRHRGELVACPICGGRFDRFKPDWNRADALCWRCGSHERHRALWLFLEHRPELLEPGTRLLHFAPEWCLRERLRRQPGLDYVTADLDPAGVDLELDVTNLALDDGSVDGILCSHVLEHVPDDRRAMRELRRVAGAGGWVVVMVPLDHSRSRTYEDPAVTTPEQRLEAYWQHDHVRLYAPDIAERLADAGFAVERANVFAELGETPARQFGLLPVDDVFFCRAS